MLFLFSIELPKKCDGLYGLYGLWWAGAGTTQFAAETTFVKTNHT
jgi:hypothetical protein